MINNSSCADFNVIQERLNCRHRPITVLGGSVGSLGQPGLYRNMLSVDRHRQNKQITHLPPIKQTNKINNQMKKNFDGNIILPKK